MTFQALAPRSEHPETVRPKGHHDTATALENVYLPKVIEAARIENPTIEKITAYLAEIDPSTKDTQRDTFPVIKKGEISDALLHWEADITDNGVNIVLIQNGRERPTLKVFYNSDDDTTTFATLNTITHQQVGSEQPTPIAEISTTDFRERPPQATALKIVRLAFH